MSALAEQHDTAGTSAGDEVYSGGSELQPRAQQERLKFDMWNKVDQYDEKHIIAESKKMKTIDMVTGHTRRQKNRRVSVVRVVEEDDLVAEEKGVMLPADMKLDNTHVQSIIDAFVGGQSINTLYAQNILKTTYQILSHTDNIGRISVPKKGQLTLVGDTHGQLSDLVYILRRQGLPSSGNLYMFNGDFVDRGSFGCEVFLVVCAMKIANPNAVFMNRGNHESERYNIAYGFEKEVITKYDIKTFHLFQKVFNWLPLGHIINKSVLVVHAGLPRHLKATIKHMQHIHRDQQIPDEATSMEDQIMQDLLWSDPTEEKGLALNDRGAGCLFGPDVTKYFLKHNRLKLLVRSHECVDEGAQVVHKGKCYTVFSASNYCGDAGNYGAIMIFHHGKHTPTEIHQYMAPVLDVERGKSLAEMEEAEAAAEEAAEEKARADAEAARKQAEQEGVRAKQLTRMRKLIDKIADYILRYHEDLEFHFHRLDHEGVGTVPIDNWCEVMQDTLQLELPWHELVRHVAPDAVAGDGSAIDYRKFLGRYYIDFTGDHSFFDGVVGKLRDQLFVAGADLHQVFLSFDENQDGVVSASEFKHAIERTLPNLHLADAQFRQLMRAVDTNGDGFIQYSEFVALFRLQHIQLQESAASSPRGAQASQWVDEFLRTMGAQMQGNKKTVHQLLAEFGGAHESQITHSEFAAALRRMECSLTDEQMAEVAAFLDTNGDGFIDAHEFGRGFHIQFDAQEAIEDMHWETRVKNQLLRSFYQNKASLLHVFHSYDEHSVGLLYKDHFIKGIQALLAVDQSVAISDDMLQHLAESLSDEHGMIAYRDFIASFEAVGA